MRMESDSHNTKISSSNLDHHNHVILFPFMSKGHTIPLLHLARVLLNRHVTVTIFTTPANRSFITKFLPATSAAIVELPFPKNIPGVPNGVENTEDFPTMSMSMFYSLVLGTQNMKPDLDRALENIQTPVSFMVSDGFLWWTLDSASKLGFPRLVFYGMSHYAMAVYHSLFNSKKPKQTETETVVSDFPWIKLTRSEYDPSAQNGEDQSLAHEFMSKATEATNNSFGMIYNSFYELEPMFTDYWNQKVGPKSWPLGPLCLHDMKIESRGLVVHPWLDEKESSSVLYVAFGSQATVSSEQVREIAKGLEYSNVNFFWVLRKLEPEENKFLEEFEKRVKNRGIVVRDWVNQMEILKHKSVKGFFSHCGWNSVMESLSAGLPILGFPMMAEQHINAKMVVEEIKIGLRVKSYDGSLNGIVKSEEVSKMVKELMEGEVGKEMRKKVEEFAVMAHKAVQKGGSSWETLDLLLSSTKQRIHHY
ncbi:hypothetical protein CsatB_013450 [Cannabis sativa]|uniref:Glycosyltransferase n=1 Tax=Cannabis sativa TaxID=3483 RepID=A0A7J6EX07_CANSA|nr:UDP-glycosyltransferase 90A1-like [Cannabis sativa]KAF4362220.1 hypothetical protein F8388_008104 [Cannabis sativa]